MIQRALSVLAFGLLTAACGPPDMSQEEVQNNLFSGKGVIGDYDFGDSWEDIKSNHAAVFEVRDDADSKQLRRNVSDNAGENGYFIGFDLNGSGKVKKFNVSINGSKQNAIVVRRLFDEAISYFDAMIGGGGDCGPTEAPDDGNSSDCVWAGQSGKPDVSMLYMEMSDPIGGSIRINITPSR